MSSSFELSSGAADQIKCLAYDPTNKAWCCGTELGQINTVFTDAVESVGETNIPALAFHPNGKDVAVAHENSLSLHDPKDLATVTNPGVVRCTMPITHIIYANTGHHIFVSSQDDAGIIVYSTIEHKVELKIDSLKSGVRTFTVDESGTYVAIVTLDGSVMIHKLIFDQGTVRRQYSGYNMVLVRNREISKSLCRKTEIGFRIAFRPVSPTHPEASHLALGHQEGSPMLLTRCINSTSGKEEWREKHHLVTADDSDVTHNQADVHLVAFSPNGHYLVTADVKNALLVWKLQNLDAGSDAQVDAIKRVALENASSLVDLAWGPEEGNNYLTLLSPDTEGRLETLINTDLGHNAPTGEVRPPVVEAPPLASPMKPSANTVVVENAAPLYETSTSVQPTQILGGRKRLQSKSTNNDLSDNDDDDLFDEDDMDVAGGDNDIDISVKRIKESFASDQLEEVPEDIQLQKLVNDRILPMEEVLKDLRAEKVAEAKTYRKPNPAFQPCAVEEFDSKDRKYLAWNLTGSIIFRRANMTDSNRYEIRFSDGSRKPVGFSDPRNYDIGALSENGVVLACPIDEENKTASRIYYFAFPSAQITDANETFSIDLPKNEEVVALTCGDGFVAASTSENYLRIFSTTGLQLSVTCLKGSTVCLVGGTNYLAVVYNKPCISVGLDLYDITPRGCNLVTTTTLPLVELRKVVWATFAEEGYFCMTDDEGYVFAFLNTPGWTWVPILRMTELCRGGQKAWPLAVKMQKMCFVMLSGERQPTIYPQPAITARNFKIPIVEGKDSKENSGLRERIWEELHISHLESLKARYYQSVAHGSEPTVSLPKGEPIDVLEDFMGSKMLSCDKLYLRDFHDLCKRQRISLAVDVMSRLKTTVALQNALTIANHTGLAQLAQILEDMINEREEAAAAATQPSYGDYSEHDTQMMMQQSQQQRQQSQGNYPDSYESQRYEEEKDDYDYSQLGSAGGLKLSRRPSMTEYVKSTSFTQPQGAPHSQSSQSRAALNPFKAASPAPENVSPLKRTRESLDALSSPSPKKAVLSRETSFSKDARNKSKHDRRVI